MLKLYRSHLEMDSNPDFYGSYSETHKSHCFCFSAGCWTRHMTRPHLSSLFSSLHMWHALDLDWTEYINARNPNAIAILKRQHDMLMLKQGQYINYRTPLWRAFEARHEADALWKQIILVNGNYHRGNLLRKLRPDEEEGCENRPPTKEDMEKSLFWNFVKEWTKPISSPF